MGISIWQLLILLAIVLLVFGGKKLRNLGSDLGTSVRGFRSAMKDGASEAATEPAQLEGEQATASTVIDGEVAPNEREKT